MERLCDYYGVEHEHGDIDTVILRPGQQMLSDALPGLPEDGMTERDRSVALAREDVAFLTWEHPLIDEAMDGLVRTGAATCARYATCEGATRDFITRSALRRPLSRAGAITDTAILA